MIKKIILSILLLTTLLPNLLMSTEKLNLSLDIRQFRFNRDTTLVEVYYGLSYQQDSSSQNFDSRPSFLIALSISEKEKIILNNIWQMEAQAADGQNQQRVMVDVVKYLLLPATYHFKLVAKNLARSDVIDSTELKNVMIRAISTETPKMSDIQLAQQIVPELPQNKDKFYKNKFRVIPNPLNVYSGENNQVYYYFELYNLATIKTDYYLIKRTIFGNSGLPLSALPAYLKKKMVRGDDAVEVGMFEISQLPSGRYFLNFTTSDSTGKEFSSSGTPFYIYNPAVMPTDRSALPLEQQMATSEIALLSLDDLEAVTGITKYLATSDEIKIINSLTTEQAKRLFLYRFWQERDLDKNTPALEFFRQIMRRIQFANDNFKEIKKKGWQTDRGRVLIVYGNPSQIQYYPNVSGFREFQAWSYDDIERGVCFIFGVVGGFGDLILLHSTKTGEKYNEYWLDFLKVTSGTTGVMDDMNTGIGQRENYREIFRRYNLELPRYLR